jgi:sulfate adenylyltransferase subunit 2
MQPSALTPHLAALEAESLRILRESFAAFKRPVLLYSIGKDSSVLLHLALKAFAPAPLPFSLLHVDTGFKFKEMISFRDAVVRKYNLNLLVESNPAAFSPLTHEAGIYTQAMKTVPLRAALDKYNIDCAIGGARRDEEKSRAKERIFSLRGAGHTWNPRMQRGEFFNMHHTHLDEGSSMRVFPLSNWQEIDIWHYIRAENIEIVPLYFAKPRPVFEQNGQLISAEFQPPNRPFQELNVRFRTLGCAPLTAAVRSDATTLDAIIEELKITKHSERIGRVIDHGSSSMEEKKREGYF